MIRFDPIQHMVGYIQSRGRARHKTATFIVMVQEGHASHLERYKNFSESEPQLRLVYQRRDDLPTPEPEEELEEGELLRLRSRDTAEAGIMGRKERKKRLWKWLEGVETPRFLGPLP